MQTTTTTTVFEDNQVLTAGQLNTMKDFLFQESRLTRIRLIGRGIAYGLEVDMTGSEVNISEGAGVTSWGFLISMGDCKLTHYKEYKLPKNLDYDYLNNALDEPVPMFELVTAINAAGATPIGSSLILSNYVVVLFLEVSTKKLQSCLGKSCDDLGTEQTFTVRKLLISIADLIKINTVNINRGGAVYPSLYELDTIGFPRTIITPAIASNYADLVNAYLSPVASVIDKLTVQLNKIYKELPVLQKSFGALSVEDIGAKWKERLFDLAKGYLNGSAFGFQYVYDAFEDVIRSYEELRCAAMHLNSSVLPNPDNFPMHLMLGNITCPPSVYRQEFEYSPLFNENISWSRKAVSLFGRTIAMLNSYFEEFIKTTDNKGVLATPSKGKLQSIGKRALPLYFTPSADIDRFWTKCLCHGCDGKKPLSYHYQYPVDSQDYGLSKLEAPLLFNLNEYNFYRLEGHLSLEQSKALTEYKRLQRRFNLPFKVRSIFMGSGGKVSTICRYPDLDAQYVVWRNTMLYYLNNLIKYSTLAREMSGNYENILETLQEMVTGVTEKESTQPAQPAAAPKSAGAATGGLKKENISFFTRANSTVFKAAVVNERVLRKDFSDLITDSAATRSSAASTDTTEKEVLNLVSDFNKNIEGLIDAMPLQFSDFDEIDFKTKYTGSLTLFVSGMKILAKIINKEQDSKMLSYLLIASVAHRVLNTLMLRPYVTIGSLADTRAQRNAGITANKSFADYLRLTGGAEHLAGVEKGNTLLLIYHTGSESADKDIREKLAVTDRAYQLEAIAKAEKELKSVYDAKVEEVRTTIKFNTEEIARAEVAMKNALEFRVSEIQSRVVTSEADLKKAESELKTDFNLRIKELGRRVNEDTSKAEEKLNADYKERIVNLRKSAEKEEVKEAKDEEKLLKSEFENTGSLLKEKIASASKEETNLKAELKEKLAVLAQKKADLEAEADEKIVVEGQRVKTRRKYLNEFEEKFNARYDQLAEELTTTGLKQLAGKVIADFTVYEDDGCCSCNPKDVKSKALTPLAVPISRVVPYNRAKPTIAKIQILNNLYDPDSYKVMVKNRPKYGTVAFTEEDYEPSPDKKRQILNYTLNNDVISKDPKISKSIIATDELTYSVIETASGNEVDSAVITFFVSIGSVSNPTYTLSGNVNARSLRTLKVTVSNANGAIVAEKISSTNSYSFDLEPGKYNIEAIVNGEATRKAAVAITDDNEVVNFDFIGKV
ncbi:MAG: hypothetical protein EOP55_00110 [Sphingobacteriales bacterium]|nr:MAG: hypothetical protein EOP55_00110 [Sphingobacteriales bacterium]